MTSALVLLDLLNSLRKRDKCSTSLAFYLFSSTKFINSINMSTHVISSISFMEKSDGRIFRMIVTAVYTLMIAQRGGVDFATPSLGLHCMSLSQC